MAAIPYASHLLPPTAGEPLRAGATVMERISAIPTPIRAVKRPFETPAAFLPFLAWELSVDVWFRAWPEATKRAITARSIELHRRKGTAYCLREYVRYAGGEVIDITAPPQRVFSGPSASRADREAWLAALPQVRTWRVQETAAFGPAKAFLGGPLHAMFVTRSFAVPSTAVGRLRRRARWVVQGVETTIRVEDFGTAFQLHLLGSEGRRVFAGRPIGRRHFVPSEAWRRLVTIAPQPRMPWRSPIGPTLQAIAAEPERVVVAGTRGRSVYSMMPIGRTYFVPSTAPLRIYERFPVVDGTAPRRGPAVQIMGTGHYGWPRSTAVVRTSVPGKRHKRAAGAGIAALRRYWMPHDGTRLQDVCRAASAAKRLSDRVLLDIGPKPRFVAGGRPLIAGVDALVVGRP
ncbi:phage tail protein I [Blastochloris tepida]|uniref:Phage tail protein I n=1 Tax=Blastochloris tepida TaxID=2233851 RepID=A0A348FYH2_9HYPH|nr:phage tail protein I [Blastochloris tepida]BBF92355.1 hypothetical protein BLTE_10400 [Blastochloris tepida]